MTVDACRVLLALGSLAAPWVAACASGDYGPAGTTASGGSSADTTSASTPGSSQATTPALDFDACFACGDQACANEASSCDSTPGCRELLDCIFTCDSTDMDCQLGCVPNGGAASAEATAATLYYSCSMLQCLDSCVPQITTTPGTTPGTGGTTGSPQDLPSGTGGTTGTVTQPTGTGGEVAGPTLHSGTNWLSFDGNWADPSAFPNGDLGISGVMYAYGDGCATVNWDPSTRCVQGTLCSPGADYANWGMALGFDLYNTGEEGTPPNTKLSWNASAQGAIGLSWELSGTPAPVQVWVTNMDPSWGGQCSADDCAINGPPDGVGETEFFLTESLYFDSLLKDDWGGTGTYYTFNPNNILAMQFKLASIAAGAISYEFCVNRIGIVR